MCVSKFGSKNEILFDVEPEPGELWWDDCVCCWHGLLQRLILGSPTQDWSTYYSTTLTVSVVLATVTRRLRGFQPADGRATFQVMINTLANFLRCCDTSKVIGFDRRMDKSRSCVPKLCCHYLEQLQRLVHKKRADKKIMLKHSIKSLSYFNIPAFF